MCSWGDLVGKPQSTCWVSKSQFIFRILASSSSAGSLYCIGWSSASSLLIRSSFVWLGAWTTQQWNQFASLIRGVRISTCSDHSLRNEKIYIPVNSHLHQATPSPKMSPLAEERVLCCRTVTPGRKQYYFTSSTLSACVLSLEHLQLDYQW